MNSQIEIPLDCPYCGAAISVLVDGSIPAQETIEDCEVCCQPMVLLSTVEDDDVVLIARRGDD